MVVYNTLYTHAITMRLVILVFSFFISSTAKRLDFADSIHFLSSRNSEEINMHSFLQKIQVNEFFSDQQLYMSLFSDLNTGDLCIQQMISLISGLLEKNLQAITFLDATGKLPSAILHGNIQWIGSYDDCLESKFVTNASSFTGQYCKVAIGDSTTSRLPNGQADLTKALSWGVCVPNGCSSENVSSVVKSVLNRLVPGNITVLQTSCDDGSKNPLDSAAVAVICLLCILIGLVLVSTLYDCVSSRRQSNLSDDIPFILKDDDTDSFNSSSDDLLIPQPQSNGCLIDIKDRCFSRVQDTPFHRFLMSFSICGNASRILSVEKHSEGSLQAIHGIRFLSMTWVILGHTYVFSLGITSNILVMLEITQNFLFQAILNATVSVDTFFLLSGTLVSYLLLRELKRLETICKINWLKFYFHRFWRLTPVYMILLGVSAALFRYLGNGPFWNSEPDKNCQQNWWTNLLYINNIKDKNMCFGWSWYLANDMQFYILSPIFIILLSKSVVTGTILVVSVAAASSISLGVITYVKDYPPEIPGALANPAAITDWMNDTYWVPWCRISPYLVGILLGYALHKTECKLKLHWVWVGLFWILAAACNLSILYGLYNVANGHPLARQVNATYAGLHRIGWAIGCAWLIFACANGYGGFINKLLSWSGFVPLSRLTYVAYLVHPMVIEWFYASRKNLLFIDQSTMVYLFFGHLVVSYGLAFVVSLAFEAPMISLEREFLRGRNAH